MAGYCQSIRQGSPLFNPQVVAMLAHEWESTNLRRQSKMTISFRIFGFAVCFSITKVITLPYDRLSTWI